MQSEKKRVLSVAGGVEDGDANQQPSRAGKDFLQSCQTLSTSNNLSHLHTTQVQPLEGGGGMLKMWLITTGLLAQALFASISKQQR